MSTRSRTASHGINHPHLLLSKQTPSIPLKQESSALLKDVTKGRMQNDGTNHIHLLLSEHSGLVAHCINASETGTARTDSKHVCGTGQTPTPTPSAEQTS